MNTLPVNEALGHIERQLVEFWSTPDEQSGASMTKVRSSTMSYAILTTAANLERSREVTELLAETHPGRALILTADGRLAPSDLTFDIRMACRLHDGSEPICHDWIELSFGAMACERAGSIAAALSLPEVPFIVEIARSAPRILITPLVPRADRVIVDTAHTNVVRIAELAAQTKSPFGDRQFVRTYTWRELVARFFDDALDALDKIRKVSIGRTTGGVTEPAALVLGWLGSRLGWAFETRTCARNRQGQTIEIELRDEQHQDLPPGELTGIWLETELMDLPLSLACTRHHDNPNRMCWQRKGARHSSHEHAMGHRGEDWVLAKAIDATESDHVYRTAVIMAAEWSGR